MNKLYKINNADNVAVALENLSKGYSESGITLIDDVPFGHKVLLTDIKSGDSVIKYSNPIGYAICDIKAGSHIHEHNIRTTLNDDFTYEFSGDKEYKINECNRTFDGYVRHNGDIGIRNEIWIISTVGCVNSTVNKLATIGREKYSDGIDGVYGFTHPFGCSQMGEDQENTRKIISALANHPNAGGVLIVSLGCENSNINVLKSYLGDIDDKRIKFLVTQDSCDEIADGELLIKELRDYVSTFKREPVPLNKLKIGFKCGGSDGFSGITANALCGKITNSLTNIGASAILTEVPEMFGAEHILMARANNKHTFDKIVNMINDYKQYFSKHNQVCYENPSPGNHDGGITTLEEKSLGCVQKGGNAVVTDVIGYGDKCTKGGLNLLTGPGNDIVSTTNLTACGAHLILFTTGRGTPLGAPVPTIKISSNTNLYLRKPNWIDFDAGLMLSDKPADVLADELLDYIVSVASRVKTKNEQNDYRDISILKDGVVL